jgi:hypothetical protein
MEHIITTPWNWCDRRCERCPIGVDCKQYSMELEEDERARARGLDPRDPNVAMKIAAENLHRALELAERAAAQRGIRLDDGDVPSERESKEGRDFAAAGHAYAVAAREATKNREQTALVAEAVGVALIVGAKTARLTHGLPPRRDDGDFGHTAFTLLLIDALLRQSRNLLSACSVDVTSGALGHAYQHLRESLERYLAFVDAEDCRRLAELIDAGEAPSPFCVITGTAMTSRVGS